MPAPNTVLPNATPAMGEYGVFVMMGIYSEVAQKAAHAKASVASE